MVRPAFLPDRSMIDKLKSVGRRCRSMAAFTLIELLVVILIIGILVAVAAPSFLGQTQKAHDSAAQQYLTVAYRAASAAATDHEGSYVTTGFNEAALAAAIQASEPELTVVAGDCLINTTTDPTYVVVDEAGTTADNLTLCNDPDRRVWRLEVIDHVLQPFGEPTLVNGAGTPIVNPPVASSAPLVSGPVQVGQTLTTSNGTWGGSAATYSYQWQSSVNGSTWSNAGTDANSYAITAGDTDDFLRAVVTATNSAGSASQASAAMGQVLPAVPINTALPVVSGTAQVGQTLSTANGTWTSNPTSYTYQWQISANGSSWSNIGSATNSSYTVQGADLDQYLRVVVAASNAGGSGSASSAAASQVLPAAPTNSVAPAVSGTAQVGQTLSTTNGTWSNNPTSYSYQWETSPDSSSWSNIGSATSGSYTAVAGDLNQYLRVAVTATNAGGAGAASSAATSQVLPAAPTNTALPTVSGTYQTGQVLTATTGAWTPASPIPTYAYQWQTSVDQSTWTNVGADAATYTLVAGDIGKHVRVAVTASNAGGAGSANSTSSAAAVTLPAPVPAAAPVVSGTAQVGQTLSTDNGGWTNTPNSYSYQWETSANQSSWSNLGSATNASYTIVAGDLNQYLRVTVTATNDGGSGAAASATSSQVLPANPVNTVAPAISDTSGNLMTHVQVGDALSSSQGSWNNSPTSFTYTWQRADDVGFTTNLTTIGTNASTYTVVAGDLSKFIRVSVQASNTGGAASVFSSNQTNGVLPATPVNSSIPTINNGSQPQPGDTLTVTSTGSWSPTPTSYLYQWQRCPSADGCAAGSSGWVNISGANSSSYSVPYADVGYYQRAGVAAVNSGGQSATAYSVKSGVSATAANPNILTAVADGSFETTAGFSNWQTGGGTISRVSGGLSSADGLGMAMQVTGTVTNNDVSVYTPITNTGTISPGATYSAIADENISSSLTGSPGTFIDIYWVDAAGADLGSHVDATGFTGVGTFRISVTGVAPAGASRAKIRIGNGNGTGTFTAKIDGVLLVKGPPPSNYYP